jgi:hypothetical protein
MAKLAGDISTRSGTTITYPEGIEGLPDADDVRRGRALLAGLGAVSLVVAATLYLMRRSQRQWK